MWRELKDVGAGELVGAADEHHNGDDERVVLPVGGSQIERLARVATPAKDEIRKKREEDTVVRRPGVDRGRRLDARRAEEAAVEMQREPFAEIVLSNDVARERDDDSVNPHGQRFALRDAPLRSTFGEVGKRTMTRQKGDDADEQDDQKKTDGVVD